MRFECDTSVTIDRVCTLASFSFDLLIFRVRYRF